MKTFVLAIPIAVVVLVSPDPRAQASIVDLGTFGGHHYFYDTGSYYSFTDARVAAQASVGRDLVSITSAEENQFLAAAIASMPNKEGNLRAAWIGLFRTADPWQWVSGDPVSYTNWRPGDVGHPWPEPTGEDAGVMYINGEAGIPLGLWGDTWASGGEAFNAIQEAAGAQGCMDGFESYPVGTFPSPPWSNSGSTNGAIDDARAHSGARSLRLVGNVGGCWAALAHLRCDVQRPTDVRFCVYNGSEPLSGCHSIYGAVSLNTEPSWTTPGRGFIAFDVDDRTGARIIRGNFEGNDPVGGPDLGVFESGRWYDVRIRYEWVTPDRDSVRISYWIDDAFMGSYGFPALPYESELSYLSLQAAEGSAWFDDVQIVTPTVGAPSGPPGDGVAALDAFPNPFRVGSVIRWTMPAEGDMRLTIHDAAGRVIRTLRRGVAGPGDHRAAWDGRDDRGRHLSGGIYFARLWLRGQDGQVVVTRKVSLAR